VQPGWGQVLRPALVRVYAQLGLYPAALPLLRGSVEERRRALGEEDVRVAESRNDLGTTLRKAADGWQRRRDPAWMRGATLEVPHAGASRRRPPPGRRAGSEAVGRRDHGAQPD
jgi:hypothetical protein